MAISFWHLLVHFIVGRSAQLDWESGSLSPRTHRLKALSADERLQFEFPVGRSLADLITSQGI